MGLAANRGELLKPYLPRLLLKWLADCPDLDYRQIQGSLVFLDIAGFTKLSERLARKGKVGAEELVSVLGSCFTQLLAVAYANGGGLIKFGGDALVLWFSGPEHQARAARSAVGMRATLRKVGRLQTSAGHVGLRMHVGVHSDLFDFFLVGESHKELIVCGPAATHTALMESTAESGEIVISEGTAAALPARVLGAPKGPGWLLRAEPPGAPPIEPDRSAPMNVNLHEGVPAAIREHVLGGGSDPEHRQVAVAFVHYGLDALLETSGPDVVARALNELITGVQRVVDRHDIGFLATDIERGGGKIMLAAGAPRSTGSNEERMLRALREIVEGEPALPIRIGVNRGYVFTGDVGPEYRRTYAVMGDAVNLAARLMAKAEPGQILASLPMLERSRTAFETKELEPFLVKGKAQPIRAALVGPVAGTRKVESAELGPLFGRMRELRVLLAALDSAKAGAGALVEIVGEPGIGKSRLIEELKARAPDLRTFSLVCDQYESSTPYFPFRLMMRVALGIPADHHGAGQKLAELVDGLAPHLLPWLPLIAIPVGVEVPPTPEVDQLDEEFRRPRLNEAVADLLSAVLPTPVLVVFEDVHWMDEASSDLLSHLLRGLKDRSWMLCVTRRDQTTGFVAPADTAVTSVHLLPLSAEEAAALAWARAEEFHLAPHEVDLLAQRSGGNPLFLLELVGGARASGEIETLPDSVDALIMARIDRLVPADRTRLRHAAVLGMAFREDLLMAVLPPDVLAGDGLIWDRLGDFLLRDKRGVFRFRHGLIREVAYEGLPYRHRRELHARAGETIEQACKGRTEDEAEILSLHFFFAGQYEKAWRYSRLAGSRAEAKYALVDAAELYRRAVASAKQVPGIPRTDLARVQVTLGDVLERVGRYGDATEAYRRARALVAGDRLEEAGLLLKEGRISERRGNYRQALGWLTRGRRVLEGMEGTEAIRQRARLAASYAAIRQGQGRYVDVIRWCEKAIRESEASGELDALAHALFILDWAYVDLGELHKAVNSRRALEIYEKLGELGGAATVLNNMGMFAYFQGRWDEAVELYDRGRQLRLRIGDTVDAAMGTTNIGEVLSDQGRLEEADAMFREALRIWRGAGHREAIAVTTSNLGRILSRSRRHREALEQFDVALKMFRELGDDGEVLETEARVAECYVLAGNCREALSRADRGLQLAEELGGLPAQIPLLYRVKGYALMQSGRLAEAGDALHRSLDAARSRRADYEIGQTLRALIDLSRLAGEPADPQVERESEAILDRLGVAALPEVPLAIAASAGRRR